MKILLTSDIHGNSEAKEKLLLMYPNMDLYLDAGDSQMEPIFLNPIISVKGNCDYCSDFLPSFTLSTPYGKLYIQHYPTMPEKILNNDSIKILINGHTHVPCQKKIGEKYFLNPGSLSYPRSGVNGTYMILEIDEANVSIDLKEL